MDDFQDLAFNIELLLEVLEKKVGSLERQDVVSVEAFDDQSDDDHNLQKDT
jgi:hypothetical protein